MIEQIKNEVSAVGLPFVSSAKTWGSVGGQRVGLNRLTAFAGFLVFAGYFLGARIGLALTFHPHPVSVMWPPNAILLGALLLNPPRVWWYLLLCALPAHLIAEWQSGVPLGMILCWFVSNVSEALLGAGTTRLLTGPSARFDSLRGIGVFVLGGGSSGWSQRPFAGRCWISWAGTILGSGRSR